MSAFQIFSLEQLSSSSSEGLDHCFINCLKYYKIDPDTIEFARDIIRDALPLKHLDKICTALKITCRVSYADETGKQHNPKEFGLKRSERPCTDLILMFEHFMPNVVLNKSVNVITNRSIKLSILVSTLLKRNYSKELI
jgi:hypothetical protein